MAKMIQDHSKIFGNELYNSLLQWLNQERQHGHVLIYAHVQPRVLYHVKTILNIIFCWVFIILF